MNEEAFFANIRARLQRTANVSEKPHRETIGAPLFWQDYTLDHEHRIAKFLEELESIGGQARLVTTKHELSRELQSALHTLGANRIGVWGGDFMQRWNLADALSKWETLTWGECGAMQTEFAQVDVGITGCDFAVADTGSVVLVASPEQGRVVSLLPSVHIVLVDSRQIVTRMGEVWAALQRKFPLSVDQAWPAAVNFVTGPSRSSDIENDLSIGVHGPAAVLAFVLNEQDTSMV